MNNVEAMKSPSVFDAILPVLLLIVLLSLSVYLFGADSSYGANQIALVLSAGLALAIGFKNGQRWEDLQQGLHEGILLAMSAILILLAVGMLIGSWILSGTVPTMIYYGLKLLSPQVFYPAACVISAVVAVSIGSSWTTAGTIGIGLIGVAEGLEVSTAVTAGAIISGAYLGDKMSPLSDTTNLAPSVAGSELFGHIQHMMWTTFPSFFIALILFAVLGFGIEPTTSVGQLDTINSALAEQFSLGWHLLVPVAVLLGLAYKKVPALPAIVIGGLVGLIFAALFQTQATIRLAGTDSFSVMNMLKGLWMSAFDGYSSASGNAVVDKLLNKGGMSSMLNTVWLIICAMSFGGAMERTGLLQRLVEQVLASVKTAGGLITATITTCIGTNIISADQYISVILPGRMYRKEYDRFGLDARNLSRALEDGGTVTSVLIPWNTCGAYMAATLGVATHSYFAFAFFNLINPILALIYAYIGFKVLKVEPGVAVATKA